MKLISLARGFGAAFALVLIGAIASHATLPLPGASGPTLGDAVTNLYSVVKAMTYQNQYGYSAGNSVSQTSGQANCTQIPDGAPMYQVLTSAGAGYVCLPTATAGRIQRVSNPTGQTINIYGSASSFTVGTQDTINGTSGSTAYTGLTTGKNLDCFTAANGAWSCTAGN